MMYIMQKYLQESTLKQMGLDYFDANNKPIYQDVSHPITKEFREVLYAEILDKYIQVKEKKVDNASDEQKADHIQSSDGQEQRTKPYEEELSR